MVVLTFSGAAVADAHPLALAAAIVGRQAGARAVVVPALAGISERFEQMSRFAREGRLHAARALAGRILDRHRDVARRAASGAAGKVISAIDDSRPTLEALLGSAAATRVPDELPGAFDRVGTNLSSLVVAAALREAGMDAVAVESDRLEEAIERISPLLQRGIVPVIAGGPSAMLSAAVVAAAVGARELQVWTDADGVPVADPSAVPAAHVVPQLSFSEALELARWGAKGLHAASLELAASRDIPVVIRNARRAERPGTVIDGQPARSPSAPAALAWRRGAAALQFSSPGTRAPVFMRRVLDLCGDSPGAPAAPPFAACLAGPSVVIAFDDREHADRVASAAREFARVMPLDDVALLSAVGESLAAEPHVAAGVLEAVQDVTVHASVHHPSGRSLTMLVDDADAGEAMRRVYERFFSAGSAESGRLARGRAS